ncbi:bifunctional 4-hydroxy-2-oxoglutarate aldolase/2-dehydro-3-deoxy-phosphogluconate aldolase [Reichenbachiella versicolor]|uniref:bifunctional 4-hydroxy-2-oxoglutarate aldolase/2-dehydro-3-deoxy-phosphogluconate aldolase n=1 Tax=Reichenbachiella versicolor TaxID=1821036 RepID=UPI000D6E1600|nr:bifunctional 4-hydroxy-2-oxoglutarate aldolase/2-dehydro-3-deoxy-phosphogluconate aldolase [Reichenbachiella versicolor]
MTRQQILERILSEKLVAIIRLKRDTYVQEVVKNIINGGIPIVEITSNTPNFKEEISKARESFPEAVIGAGTIFTKQLAIDAIEAGAQYLVTPSVNTDIISIAHSNNIPVIMGCLTPTEIAVAVEHKADIIKLFPAGNFGIDYFKTVKAPFSDAKIFAVGGVSANNIGEWVKAGAAGFGLGGSIYPSSLDSIEECLSITKNAKNMVETLKDAFS